MNPQALSPREKVLKALRLFKKIFAALARDKAALLKKGTSKLEFETLDIIKNSGKNVNEEKLIGKVPGVKFGDAFQYKVELSMIGLHFKIFGGIDYLERGALKLATSIVASEGSEYNNRFESNVLFYSGEGGNMMSKDHNVVEDQKMTNGNLALATSMSAMYPVRVVRGLKRSDKQGKLYVYEGLYMVEDYWEEKGHKGNLVFMFKLCRV